MEITLKVNGEDKVFVQDFVSAYYYRKALELQKEEEKQNELTVKALDKEVDLVCEVFGNQFTRDEFYLGVNAPDLRKTINDILIHDVMGIPREEIEDFLEQVEEAAETE